MGFMNWLMKGVGFESEEVYDNSVEKQKKREEKLRLKEEKQRQKSEYKARKAQEKADRMAKKYSLKQAKDIPEKPKSVASSYAENPEQYNTSSSYNSPINNYGLGSSNVGGYGTKNVEFVFPQSFDDAGYVINFLKEGESVMLNLNQMNDIDSQRLLDCTSGAVYALNGNIRHVESNIFLITPEGFNIKIPDHRSQSNNGQNQ